MLQSLLDKFNVKYEDLTTAEKDTLQGWAVALEKKELTLQDVKDHIRTLIEAVERELADTKESTSFWLFVSHRKKDLFLKARLKNYLILSDFLTAPDKAKKYIEQSIQNIKK